jgi:hypothetical protein
VNGDSVERKENRKERRLGKNERRHKQDRKKR